MLFTLTGTQSPLLDINLLVQLAAYFFNKNDIVESTALVFIMTTNLLLDGDVFSMSVINSKTSLAI